MNVRQFESCRWPATRKLAVQGRLGPQLTILLVLSTLACAPPREVSPPNIILVVIDTLRADRVNTFDGDQTLTPFLDSLAEAANVFHNGFSTSAWTSPAVASLLTSRYPSQHRVLNFDSVLPASELTLGEILTERGYRTGGFSSNQLIGRSRGFQQGFEFFRARGTQEIQGVRLSERTAQAGHRALQWIDGQPADATGPIFLYLHVMDPHVPYAPSSSALDHVFASRPRPDSRGVNALMKTHLSAVIPEEVRQDVRGLYDAEVSSTDAALAEFFVELSNRDLLAHSIVIVTSDHGEELWDHDMFGHHHSLHAEVLRVPMLIQTPGQRARRDVSEAVSLVDIAPTLLDLLGESAIPSFEGRSLVPLMSMATSGWTDWSWASTSAEVSETPGVLSELILLPIFRRTAHERSVVAGDYQLVRDADGKEHFIDLSQGSGSGDEAKISDAERRALRARLDRFVARVESTDASPATPSGERIMLDDESREELRALGYLD